MHPTPARRPGSSPLHRASLGAAVFAAGVLTVPHPAAAASSGAPCNARLDGGSRVVVPFTDGGRRLANAGITVTRQRADRNAHCLRIRVPGRQVQARWRADFYRLRGGRCIAESQSTQFFPLRSISTGFRVGAGQCLRWTYRITVDGRSYSASVHRRHR